MYTNGAVEAHRDIYCYQNIRGLLLRKVIQEIMILAI